MKNRSLSLTAESVCAILAGTKTQTRCLPKLQPETRGSGYYLDAYCSEAKIVANPRGMSDEWCWWTADHRPVPSTMLRCPYGQPGDQLWTKESWRTGAALDNMKPSEIGERAINAGYAKAWAPILRADGSKQNSDVLRDFGDAWGKVRSPLFMPRWASRLTLEIVEVRLQRLQEISEDDARAEGCDWRDADIARTIGLHRIAFAKRWDAINGKRRRRECLSLGDPGYTASHPWRTVVDESAAWSANPWVFALTFRRLP